MKIDTLTLSNGRLGRIFLHLICLVRDGRLQWHVHGMLREIGRGN